jgi:hypothetical protein
MMYLVGGALLGYLVVPRVMGNYGAIHLGAIHLGASKRRRNRRRLNGLALQKPLGAIHLGRAHKMGMHSAHY